jgi:periplasmic mercuric ion binding protein
MNLARAALLLALPLTSSIAFAAVKTLTLSVPGMTCELCPITIRKAVSRVPGVSKVDASYDTKQAVVTFDDAKTSVEALTKATANAGFPSKPVQ